jgi:hypothetical protein
LDTEKSESEIEIEEETKKRKRGRPNSIKPFTQFGDTYQREKTDQAFHVLAKLSSELKAPFDILTAKLNLRYYYTAGENYDQKKGQMFNQVVTLVKFGFH